MVPQACKQTLTEFEQIFWHGVTCCVLHSAAHWQLQAVKRLQEGRCIPWISPVVPRTWSHLLAFVSVCAMRCAHAACSWFSVLSRAMSPMQLRG